MKLFIVNIGDSSRVITKSSFMNDIRNKITENKSLSCLEIGIKNIDSYATDTVNEYNGKSITKESYDVLLSESVKSLIKYAELTPYKFKTNYIKNIKQILN